MKAFRVVLLCLMALFAMPLFAKTLTIGIDVSQSNRLIENPLYAKLAAKHVRSQIAALQLGDFVRIQKFGERNPQNLPSETIRITRAMRPAAVAELVGRYIEALPSKMPEGDGATNIVAFLEFGSHFDCASGSKILLLTDGIESSSYITARHLLSGQPLPPPDAGLLSLCDVEFFGFGQTLDGSLPPQAIKAARASWAAWMKAAGANFSVVVDP